MNKETEKEKQYKDKINQIDDPDEDWFDVTKQSYSISIKKKTYRKSYFDKENPY